MYGLLGMGLLALGLTSQVSARSENISVDFDLLPPCAGEFRLKNSSDVPYVMRDGGLPWKARDLSTWVAVEDVTMPGKVTEPGTQSWDYFGSRDVTIPPGGFIKGSIELVELFHGLRHPRKRDTIVFVRWECPHALCPGSLTFTGSLIVGAAMNCRGNLKWYREGSRGSS